MRFVLLGAPGVGKGTQANLLARQYNIPKLSTGEILRSAVDSKTVVGLRVKSIIESGQLVDDNIVEEIIRERLQNKDCKDGFIIDGFPRTVNQAKSLDHILSILPYDDILIVFIYMTQGELEKRLSGRIICDNCHYIYNKQLSLSKTMIICPDCGGDKFTQRLDDDAVAVQNRFLEYGRKTKPVVDFYSERPGFVKVNGALSVNEVFESIVHSI